MCMGTPEPKKIKVNLAPPPPASVFAERIIQPLGEALGEAQDMMIDPSSGLPVIGAPRGLQGRIGRNKMDVNDDIYQSLQEARGNEKKLQDEIKSIRLSLNYLEGDELNTARESLNTKQGQLEASTRKIEKLSTGVFVGQFGGGSDEQLKSLLEAKATLTQSGEKALTDKQAGKLVASLNLGENPVEGSQKVDYENRLNKAIKARRMALKDLIIEQQTMPTGSLQEIARKDLGTTTTIKRGREQLKITI